MFWLPNGSCPLPPCMQPGHPARHKGPTGCPTHGPPPPEAAQQAGPPRRANQLTQPASHIATTETRTSPPCRPAHALSSPQPRPATRPAPKGQPGVQRRPPKVAQQAGPPGRANWLTQPTSHYELNCKPSPTHRKAPKAAAKGSCPKRWGTPQRQLQGGLTAAAVDKQGWQAKTVSHHLSACSSVISAMEPTNKPGGSAGHDPDGSTRHGFSGHAPDSRAPSAGQAARWTKRLRPMLAGECVSLHGR